jgi:predicted transcriptional regulator
MNKISYFPSGKQIAAARVLLDWSQADLANKTSMATASIARIEQGSRNPRVNSMDKIIHAFKDSGVHFIMGDKEIGITLKIKS